MASASSVAQDCFHSYPAGLCHQLSQEGASRADLLSENSFEILHLTTACQMESDNPSLVSKKNKKKNLTKMRTQGNSLEGTFRKYCSLCHLEETAFGWRAMPLARDVQY